MDLRPDLAHEDAARVDELPAEALHAAPLRVAVASVARAALSLLVRHGASLASAVDRLDAHFGVAPPVALLAPVVLAPLLLEDGDLRPAALRGDRPDHL